MLHTSSFGIRIGFGNSLGIDVNAYATRSESLRGGNYNPPVTAADVVDNVISCHLGERKHALNDIVW